MEQVILEIKNNRFAKSDEFDKTYKLLGKDLSYSMNFFNEVHLKTDKILNSINDSKNSEKNTLFL